MIEAPLTRRHILGATALFVPVALLGGCATPLGSYGVDEGVRRLLTLSSQRAFERLIRPGGFYDDQLTRLTLPETGGRTTCWPPCCAPMRCAGGSRWR
ncbi:DUF4197 family protein [Sphingomonas hankookensis]|uniref:DUF4197 family protein n=1 Tax=Sphingomonas hankookensis TaxID=563996 RepID=UPI003F7AEFE0